MTQKNKTLTHGHTKSWPLQDAKARLSELVRKAQETEPQRVSIHGRDAVVVMSITEFERIHPQLTGADLVSRLQSSPLEGVDFERLSTYSPVRDIQL